MPAGLLRVAIVAGLLAAGAALALHTAARTSLTADEPKHLGTGLYLLREGRCCLGRDNAPAVALNALAWLGREAPGARHLVPGEDPWRSGRSFLLAEPDLPESVFRARVASVVLLAGLGALVFVWSRSLYGFAGGALSLALFAFSPTLLAHGSLATGDVHAAASMTLAAFAWERWHRRPGPASLALAGASLGLALAAKYSALALLPAFGVLALLAPRGIPPGRRALGAAGRLGAALALAAVVVWLAYGGSLASRPLSGGAPALPGFADWWDGLRAVRLLGERGWNSFFLGEYRLGGWWSYYPVALAVKTPLPVLALWLAAAVATPWVRDADRRREAFVWLPAAALFAAAVASSLNIGVRHLLPVLPLLHVFTGRLARVRLPAGAGRSATVAARAVVAALLAWHAAATLANHPHHLAWFNALAGGPRDGWRVLGDSNVDWGQDLPALRRYLEREGVAAVRLAYFGPAPPGRYGIRYQPLPSFDQHPEDPVYTGPFERDLVVVSANNLLGIDPSLRDAYAWLRDREPVARPGWSLFVFDLADDFGARREMLRLYRRHGQRELEALERERLRRALEERD